MSTPDMDHEPLARNAAPPQAGETGYPWLFFSIRRSWVIGFIVALLVIGLGGAFYVWYNHPGNDTAPDSLVGLSYATLGTVFLVLAAVLYGVRRRLRRRAIGQLHASLNWHMFFAIIGLALLVMHAFGQFNPISGTYALCGMIALTLSGLVGRVLDRFMPRLIAGEVAKVLTVQGEDRVVTISQKLQAIVIDNTEEKSYGFTLNAPGSAAMPVPKQDAGPNESSRITTKLSTPWDLAYVSLEPTPQELDRNAPRHPLVPDKKSTFPHSGAAMHGAQEQITALQDVHRAMQREQFYRYIIHYWRVFHISLALLTIGLVIWHLIFAAQLLLPRMFQGGAANTGTTGSSVRATMTTQTNNIQYGSQTNSNQNNSSNGRMPSAPTKTLISTKQVNVHGRMVTILTTFHGMTLYERTSDPAPDSSCTGPCAHIWPPLLSNRTVMSMATLGGKLRVHLTANGKQVEYNGHPLYTYSGDMAPGQTNGQGVGNVWQVVIIALQRQHW